MSTRKTGQPVNLGELIEALTSLVDLGPVDRAKACPGLIEATKGVLARERGAAMLDATSGPDSMSQVDLARELGIGRVKVAKAIHLARADPPLERTDSEPRPVPRSGSVS